MVKKKKSSNIVCKQGLAVVIRDDAGRPQYIHGMLLDITEQKNAEIMIKQREAVLSAVAETAQYLLKSANWRNEINRILKLLGEASGASHVYIFENHLRPSDGILLSSMKYEWTTPGIKPELDNPNYQDSYLRPTVPGLEDWYANLSAGKAFYGSAQQYPRFWKKIFEPQGLKTLLDVPIIVNDQWWGIFGFDDYEKEMPWSQAEIDALMAAAGNLGTAISRQQADLALRASEEKFQHVFHHTYVAMAISHTVTNALLDVNDAFCKTTGYSRAEAIGKRAGRDLNVWVNQADRNTILAMLHKQGYVDEYKVSFRHKNGDIRVGLLFAGNVMIAGEICQLYSFVDISNIDDMVNELKAKNNELQSFNYTV
jgi:PAS domain S-box-containing protein